MAVVRDLGNSSSVVEPHIYTPNQFDNKPYQGATPLTVGTVYPTMRAIVIVCTLAGNVSVTLANGSVVVISVATGTSTFNGAVKSINASGTTATAVYYSMK